MIDQQVEALRDAARDGIDYDGLCVERTADGYRVGVDDSVEAIDGAALPAWVERHRQYVDNWWFFARVVDDERPFVVPFLRWLERAETTAVPARYRELRAGITRSWGQLRITVTCTDGHRRYAIVHTADVDRDTESLTSYDDPAAATDLARFDDADRYRPLKSAPTLRSGWAFPALSAAEAVEVIDRFYPVSIANWYAERAGDLDVRHFRETAARQSGIYRVVESIPAAGVRAITSACCSDEMCLKRRRWELDGETDLDVPAGDGRIPCREPCSLYLEAARTFAPMTNEAPPQLPDAVRTAIVDLCTELDEDGPRTNRVGAMDEPDNPYRIRFLRSWIAASTRREKGVDADSEQPDDDH